MSVPRVDAGEVRSASDGAKLIGRSERILIIAGAGVSVSCGIPDFRSPVTGLYNSNRHIEEGIPSAELFFDLEYFKLDPCPFYRIIMPLTSPSIRPSKTHYFFTLLEKRGTLQAVYTQNIDGLESRAGCSRVVHCHGSMRTLHCTKCRKKDTLERCAETISRKEVPYCRVCHSGVLKPDITFFGESYPASVGRAMQKDCSSCDLVLVLGTSLQVRGAVLEVLERVPLSVPRILINKEQVEYPKPRQKDESNKKRGRSKCCSVAPARFSASLLGESDVVSEYVCHVNGWAQQLSSLMEDIKTDIPDVEAAAAVPNSATIELGPQSIRSTRRSTRQAEVSYISGRKRCRPHGGLEEDGEDDKGCVRSYCADDNSTQLNSFQVPSTSFRLVDLERGESAFDSSTEAKGVFRVSRSSRCMESTSDQRSTES